MFAFFVEIIECLFLSENWDEWEGNDEGGMMFKTFNIMEALQYFQYYMKFINLNLYFKWSFPERYLSLAFDEGNDLFYSFLELHCDDPGFNVRYFDAMSFVHRFLLLFRSVSNINISVSLRNILYNKLRRFF